MANTDPTKTSPKVIVATAVAVIASGVLASLQYLQTTDGQQLFASLPPVLVVGILAVITGAATAIGGYVKGDPARQGALPKQAEQQTLESDPGATDTNPAADEADPAA